MLEENMTEWAVVTGASRGIGAAVAKLLKDGGIKVLAVDLIDPENDYSEEFVRADLSKPAEAADLVRAAIESKDVTRLAHVAGYCIPASIEAATVEGITKEINISTISLISLAQVVIPSMKRLGKGRIVGTGSRAGLGKEERVGYAAAKSGLSGIPGPTNTYMLQTHNDPNGSFIQKRIRKGIPVQFVAEPVDIAVAFDFLLSDRARFITGQVLNVCGGTSVNFLNRDDSQ
jgi:NAD(P)-dependent dehydrogenase (short-subunit alcohol dehydrogenase family)